MSTSIEHLPQRKQEQLRAITALISNATDAIDRIILFGSYARGDWVEDLATGYFSDFDLLIVLDDKAAEKDLTLWSNLTSEARRITQHVPVNLMPMHFKDVNAEIRTGHYFFADVVAQGILLHNANRITLAKPKAVTPEERLALGKWNFTYWFNSAGGFWQGTGYYAAKGMLPHAAFLLHQSVERYFHAVLLVFNGYKPKSHDIEWLANETAPLHELLKDAMPRTTPEDKDRFRLLKVAYIQARYSKTYRITHDELNTLRDHVLDLATRIRTACTDRLATILGRDSVGDLPNVPQFANTEDFPPPPSLDDPEQMEQWKKTIAELSEARGREEGRQEGREEGLREGEERGLEKGQRLMVIQMLELRFGPLSAENKTKLEYVTPDTLHQYAERLLTAASIEEVFSQS